MKNNAIDVTIGQQSPKSNRIEYIDAMRGFAILMVVMAHVFTFCFGRRLSVIHGWFWTFTMPLFFFISGFVSYKVTQNANLKDFGIFILKKLNLLWPAFFFFFLSCFFTNFVNLYEWGMHASKGGYWFTIALFYYFVLFGTIRYIVNRFHIMDKMQDALLMLLGIIISLLPFALHKFIGLSQQEDLFSITKLNFFAFFVFGTLVRKYYDIVCQWLDNDGFITILLIISVGGYIALVKTEMLGSLRYFLAPEGILLCVAYFRKHSDSISQNTRLGRVLQFVGRRTLDIYMLHYFVLPRHLEFIGEWFEVNSMPFMYFFIGFVVAIYVIGVSLLISSIIRFSPICAKWLFGVKNK